MNRTSNEDSPNVSSSSINGTNRVSSSGNSLMNGNRSIAYRRSPIFHQQPQSFDTLGSPSTTSYTSEEISENIHSFEDDSNINDLSLRFDQLQRQIEVLNETQSTQDERYKRSRQENDALLNRIHGLEDQLRDLELNSEARAKEDEKRFKETMAKQMKVQSQECEQHLHANFLLQQEAYKYKNDLLKCESTIKALRNEKEALESELEEKNNDLVELDEEVHKLKLLVKHLKDEEKTRSNLISILNEELEDNHNRQQQLDQLVASSSHNYNQSPKLRSASSRRSSVTSGFGDDISTPSNNHRSMRDIDGLEASLSKLRDENKQLQETNEELQARLLNIQLEEGRSLIQEGNKSYSLADELGDIDVQKLMDALKEQQEDNARLRKYMDEILLKIVEQNPEILDKT